MSRLIVSIITPTIPERHALLMETIYHVREQTYLNVEHVVVSDGPDDEIEALTAWESEAEKPRVYQLGRHWSGLLPVESIGVAPILTGLLLARGEYLAWLCDDERFTSPHALSLLVDHLEATGADFVYPKVRMWWNGTSPDTGWDIGKPVPEYGQFTWCLFRADLLQKAMPRFHGPTFNDADLMTRWVEAGATWSFLPQTLVTHRADR